MIHLIDREKRALAFIIISFLCLFSLYSTGYASDLKQVQAAESSEDLLKKAADMIGGGMYESAETVLLDFVNKEIPDRGRAYFLLGMLYKAKGDYQKAEEHLSAAAGAYPLLKDYALKYLTDLYYEAGQFEKVIGSAGKIRNRLLLQDAEKALIGALFALDREDEAEQALAAYIEDFPDDRVYALLLAGLYKKRNETEKAAHLLKEVYISASPQSEEAYAGLKELKADFFTGREILERAGNLFKAHNYREAEAAYKEVLDSIDRGEKPMIIFRMAMSQFRQKKYSDSARSFGRLGGPKSMYYRARSYYRINDRRGFEKAKKAFEKQYPTSKYLALVFLMEAEEYGRRGMLDESARSYRKVIQDIPREAEAALWGIGWMHFTHGDYHSALGYFSRLAYYTKSGDYYKYLYWKARTEEKLRDECIEKKNAPSPPEEITCDGSDTDYFEGLPSNETYYGFLIKQRSPQSITSGVIAASIPPRPEGEAYERIEGLLFLGLRDEAVGEVVDAIKKTNKRGELLYLGHMAAKAGEYKSVIAFAEPQTDRVFLPFSYPLAFWDAVTYASETFQVEPYLIAALIREESRFDPEVMSWAGAVGLMQLMPATADRMNRKVGIELQDRDDLKVPVKNILLGSYYLSELIREFRDIPLAIAAYNAGENRVREWMSRFDMSDIFVFIENIPYQETQRYVQKVLKSYWQYRVINGLPVRGIDDDG